MKDIVEMLRLRPAREMLYLDGCIAVGYGPSIEEQAANEIERLRADLAAARTRADRLQHALDSRPALNAGLYEAYVRWTAQVGEMEFMHTVCTEN